MRITIANSGVVTNKRLLSQSQIYVYGLILRMS